MGKPMTYRNGFWYGEIKDKRGRTGKVELHVNPAATHIEIRANNVYDGVHVVPYPQEGRCPAERGYDERAVAEGELDRLQGLLDAGQPLWED